MGTEDNPGLRVGSAECGQPRPITFSPKALWDGQGGAQGTAGPGEKPEVLVTCAEQLRLLWALVAGEWGHWGGREMERLGDWWQLHVEGGRAAAGGGD